MALPSSRGSIRIQSQEGVIEKKNASINNNDSPNNNLPLLETQMKTVYLHVQTLPTRTIKLAGLALLQWAAK